jgi:hypothetical protein
MGSLSASRPGTPGPVLAKTLLQDVPWHADAGARPVHFRAAAAASYTSARASSTTGVMSAPHAEMDTMASMRSFLVIPLLRHVATRQTHSLLY